MPEPWCSHEEINAFDPPSTFEYRITTVAGSLGRLIPLNHELGRLSFSESESGTQVHWVSRFEIRFPLLGRVIEGQMGRSLEGAFKRLLVRADQALESA